MQRSAPDKAGESLVESVLTASRVLVAISARSLVEASNEVTLPQYRTLVVLQARGPQSLQQLADELQVVPSTATRMCDRLVRKGLIRRAAAPHDRREIDLRITTQGTTIVNAVTGRRRSEIKRIVTKMSKRRRADLIAALDEFAVAAGEPSDDAWFMGWA